MRLGRLTFLTTPAGNPYTDGGIGNRFRKWCDAAGLDHLSTHGVRKGVGAVTAELGATGHQIMVLLGHATPTQAATYTRSANRREMGTGIADAMNAKVSHLHPDAKKWDKKTG